MTPEWADKKLDLRFEGARVANLTLMWAEKKLDFR